MDSSISLLGVLLSAVAAMVIGSFWYSPTFFLKPWQKMTGTSDADMKKAFGPAIPVLFVVALLTAYVMGHFISLLMQVSNVSAVTAGVQTALWVWLGISVTTIIAGGIFEPRDKMVMVITAGNRLVTLLAMGLILGAFM